MLQHNPSVEAGQNWRDIPSEGKKEPPYHYLALLLSEFCEWLTREMELDASEFLRNRMQPLRRRAVSLF